MHAIGLAGQGTTRLAGPVIEIDELDVHDDAALGEYFAVEQAAQRADRPYAVLRTYLRLEQLVRRPSPWFRRTLLAARQGGRIVGVAELSGAIQDNLHLAELEVDVLPEARRRGIGRALHDEVRRRAHADGRTTMLGEACRPTGDGSSSGHAFATALGFEQVHEEDHHVLDLPVPDQVLSTPSRSAEGYEILSWRDRAPDDLVGAYAAMLTQMGNDVPAGEVDHEPVVIDVERIRVGEERTTSHSGQVVAAARRTSDGVLGGYTLVYLPVGENYVEQDDTLVMPEHRGRGLGLALKAEVFRILAAEHPGRRRIHTWNAVDNAPMQRINRVVGFRPVERLLEMQRRDA